MRRSSDKGSTCDPGHGREVDQVEISGSLIARNTIMNLIGQALPLVVGVVTIPMVVHGLGTDRFGLLSLAWVVLGYFTIFDLGLGRAATKYVAAALGRGEDDQVPQIIWTAVTFQAALGFLGALVLLGITDLLVENVLKIPPELLGEAKDTFHLLALSIPLVLVSSSFSGVLEAAQRFDLVNAVRIPSSILTFILPLVGLHLGFGLPGIVALIMLARVVTLVAFLIMGLRIVPNLREYSISFARFYSLFSFGGWVMISNLVIPIFVYLDRFLIGALLTMSAVTFYTVPFDVVNRLLIIPASIASVLFPTFSSLSSCNEKDRINIIVMRSTKYILTVMVPLTVLLLIFSEDILRVWLGNEFAEESAIVFRLIGIGVLLNSIGYIPFALIQGIGRPDIVVKYHLVELPIYVVVVFFLIGRFGINGAALAWCLRMTWAIPIFFLLCGRVAEVPLKSLSDNGTSRSFILAAVILIPSIALPLLDGLGVAAKGFLAGALLIASLLFSWFTTFDRIDRDFMKSLILRVRNCRLIKGDDVHV